MKIMKIKVSKESQKKIFAVLIIVIAIIALFIVHHKGWGTVLESILTFTSLFAAFYLSLSKSIAEELGKKAVDITFLEKETSIVEQVKKEFNEALLQLQADLKKENIAYKVDYSSYNTEKAKALIDLYRKLANAYETGLYMGGIWKLYQERSIDMQTYITMRLNSITKYVEALGQAGSAIRFCRFFLDNDLCLEIKLFNNKVGEYANQYLDAISKDDDEINKLLKRYDEFTGFVNELYGFAERIRALIQPENKEDK